MFNDHTVGIGGSIKTRASIEILNDVTLTSGSSGVNSIISGRNSDSKNRRRSKSASVLDSRYERCIKTKPLKVSSISCDATLTLPNNSVKTKLFFRFNARFLPKKTWNRFSKISHHSIPTSNSMFNQLQPLHHRQPRQQLNLKRYQLTSKLTMKSSKLSHKNFTLRRKFPRWYWLLV